MRTDFASIVIIMGLATVVNASESKTLQTLIKDAMASGESTKPTSEDVKVGEISPTLNGKGLEVDAKDAADDATHDFIVFMKNDEAVSVEFSIIREGKWNAEYVNLVCDPSGKMNQCFRATGQKDESGNPIRGSAKVFKSGLKDRKMNSLLRHEFDFWLKGKYRKVAAKR